MHGYQQYSEWPPPPPRVRACTIWVRIKFPVLWKNTSYKKYTSRSTDSIHKILNVSIKPFKDVPQLILCTIWLCRPACYVQQKHYNSAHKSCSGTAFKNVHKLYHYRCNQMACTATLSTNIIEERPKLNAINLLYIAIDACPVTHGKESVIVLPWS